MAVPGVKKIIKLNSGNDMPALGFGTWQAEPGVVAKSVELAIRGGFRHIDCAALYMNEPEIGECFQKLFADKVVDRKDLFITSKCWNTDHAPKDVEAACRKTLSDLKLEYLDLYLVHWPVAWKHPEGGYKCEDDYYPENEKGGTHQADVPLADTWAAMESLVEKGLVKDIGISNFSLEDIDKLSKTWKRAPAVNQVEAQPFCPQFTLAKGMKEKAGIELQAFCPLGVGYGKDDTAIQNAVFNNAEIKKIAAEAGISGAMLCLQWGLDKGYVVLSKSTTESRIAENAAAMAGALSPEIIAKVDALFASGEPQFRRRSCNPETWNEEFGPFFTSF